ncbi:MAG: signal peptidase I [Deltaproteobacteria bacterium]|nr:signal peptidase I [Deltaproteobacteria bacterium]
MDAARREGHYGKLRAGLDRLDELLDKHLAFGRKSALREYAESIGVAVLVALLLRAFVVEAFKIPSGSMIPTLKVGDHIFVNKFTYGIRIPWTNLRFFTRKPHRGDVIVFIFPQDESKDFIKRIVAVGGDTIAVRNNHVYVNEKPIQRVGVKAPCSYPDSEEGSDHYEVRQCAAFDEEQDAQRYRVIQDTGGFPSEMKPTKVPEDHVFVMGDNRDNSHDSRVWGFVPGSHIKGKALIIWWSSGQPNGVRWRRFFDLVHATPLRDSPTAP